MENLTGGADFLGSHMFGSDSYFNAPCAKQIDKVLQCQNNLKSLKNPQVLPNLLLSCPSLVKSTIFLRTVLSIEFLFQIQQWPAEFSGKNVAIIFVRFGLVSNHVTYSLGLP